MVRAILLSTVLIDSILQLAPVTQLGRANYASSEGGGKRVVGETPDMSLRRRN